MLLRTRCTKLCWVFQTLWGEVAVQLACFLKRRHRAMNKTFTARPAALDWKQLEKNFLTVFTFLKLSTCTTAEGWKTCLLIPLWDIYKMFELIINMCQLHFMTFAIINVIIKSIWVLSLPAFLCSNYLFLKFPLFGDQLQQIHTSAGKMVELVKVHVSKIGGKKFAGWWKMFIMQNNVTL